jgi:hypothetical protein
MADGKNKFFAVFVAVAAPLREIDLPDFIRLL